MPLIDPDVLAANLLYPAAVARSMPPAYDGCGMSIPFISPGGHHMGRLLPGRGLVLNDDLKNLGITRQTMPWVYERSQLRRLYDHHLKPGRIQYRGGKILKPELGAITTYDGIISSRAGGKASDFMLALASITTVANNWSTLWRATGSVGTGTYTNIPTGAVPDRASAGAWSLGVINPTNPDKRYLLTLGYTAAQQLNSLLVVDLLVGAGNITTNVGTGAQTVSSAAITRQYPSGSTAYGFVTFDITTQLGATPANITVNKYTNQAGTANQTTAAIALLASGIVMRLTPVALGPFIQLASGDWGAKSVEECTVSALMGAGVIALNIYWPLSWMPGIAATTYIERDSTAQVDGLTELVANSFVIGAVTGYALTNTTSTGVVQAFIRTCAG